MNCLPFLAFVCWKTIYANFKLTDYGFAKLPCFFYQLILLFRLILKISSSFFKNLMHIGELKLDEKKFCCTIYKNGFMKIRDICVLALITWLNENCNITALCGCLPNYSFFLAVRFMNKSFWLEMKFTFFFEDFISISWKKRPENSPENHAPNSIWTLKF